MLSYYLSAGIDKFMMRILINEIFCTCLTITTSFDIVLVFVVFFCIDNVWHRDVTSECVKRDKEKLFATSKIKQHFYDIIQFKQK